MQIFVQHLRQNYLWFLGIAQQNLFDSLLFLSLFFAPLIDTLNGITLRMGIGSIAQPLKFLIMGFLFLRIAQLSRFAALGVLLYGTPFFISDYLAALTHQDLFFVTKDFGFTTKKIFFIEYLVYGVLLIRRYDVNTLEKMLRLSILFGFIVVSINLMLGGLGFGEAQYQFYTPQGVVEIGTRGFFQDGNTVAAYLSIFGSFLAFSIWPRKMGSALFFLFFLYLSILKSTKVALLSPFVVLALVPFISERTHWLRLTQTKIKASVFIFIGLVLMIPSSILFLQSSKIGAKISDMYNRYNFINFILSDRDRFLAKGWYEFVHHYSWLEILIGKGYKAMSVPGELYHIKAKAIELDLFDILFEKGLIGVLLTYGIWLAFFYLIWRVCFFTEVGKYAPQLFFQIFFGLALSVTSGHILGSGTLGSYYGFIFALIYHYYLSSIKNGEPIGNKTDHSPAPH